MLPSLVLLREINLSLSNTSKVSGIVNVLDDPLAIGVSIIAFAFVWSTES